MITPRLRQEITHFLENHIPTLRVVSPQVSQGITPLSRYPEPPSRFLRPGNKHAREKKETALSPKANRGGNIKRLRHKTFSARFNRARFLRTIDPFF